MADHEFTPDELATEEWRDVVGFEGLYSVSSLGRVRRDAPPTKGGFFTYPGRILKAKLTRGYLVVGLWKDSKQRWQGVHRLVAKAFLGEPPQRFQTNHKDCNKLNNRLENLEWCTAQTNYLHAIRHGFGSIGIRNGRAKLQEADILQIRARHAAGGITYNKLSRAYNVSGVLIRLIVNRKIWRHI